MTDCEHAMVSQVTIDKVDDQVVSFWTRSDSKTGDPNERLRRLFTVPLKELWTAPIPNAPLPVALSPGATGPLYLSRTGWETTTADGFQIFGAGSDQVEFKFPVCLAESLVQDRLEVIPTKVEVQGYPEGKHELVVIDLLGPQAAPAQDIEWNGADYLEIQLAAAAKMKLWPTRIVVAGSPKSRPAVRGQVDLLDSELAGLAQHLQIAPGAPVSLALTQDGFGAFHVVAGM
jgi:hypothetical protein